MRRRRTFLPVLLLAQMLGVAGCAERWVGPAEAPPLPPLAAAGPEAPARNAIQGAADAFGDRAGLAGRPAEAAVALARLEWLAEAVPRDLAFANFPAIAGPAAQAARSEARRAAGIAADAPAPAVMAALDRAASALLRPGGTEQEARAALAPPLFAPDAPARIAALPFLPQAASATALLRRALEFGPDDRFPLSLSMAAGGKSLVVSGGVSLAASGGVSLAASGGVSMAASGGVSMAASGGVSMAASGGGPGLPSGRSR